MATTKIWAVKNRLGHVLQYAEDEEKTANQEWNSIDYQSMRDVMDYAMNDAKTDVTANEAFFEDRIKNRYSSENTKIDINK